MLLHMLMWYLLKTPASPSHSTHYWSLAHFWDSWNLLSTLELRCYHIPTLFPISISLALVPIHLCIPVLLFHVYIPCCVLSHILISPTNALLPAPYVRLPPCSYQCVQISTLIIVFIVYSTLVTPTSYEGDTLMKPSWLEVQSDGWAEGDIDSQVHWCSSYPQSTTTSD